MISIVIPVYNMERHLERCLSSCLQQTYQDYEVVLIDDGSTDKSADICDRYVAQYENVRCVHQENGGVAVAKNAGIALAKGDFLTFVDSDDFIDPDYLEALISASEGADLVIGGLKFLVNNGKSVYAQMTLEQSFFTRDQFGEELWKLLDKDGLNFHVAKLYKKAVIDRNEIRFTDFRKTGGDDTVFNFDYLEHAETVSVVPRNIYNYISYSSSTSHKYDDKKWERGKNLDSILQASCEGMGILSEEMQAALDKRICHLAYWVTSEIASKKFPLSKRCALIRDISYDDRFQKAYQNTFRDVSYEEQINRLYRHRIFGYVFIKKKQVFNLKGKIYRLVPSFIKRTYRNNKARS